MEGLVFRGAYLRGEICVSKSIGLAYIVRSKFTVFALLYFVFEGTSPPGGGGGLYLEQFPTLLWLTMDCSEIISLSFLFLQAPLYVNATSILTCPPGKIVLRVSPRN